MLVHCSYHGLHGLFIAFLVNTKTPDPATADADCGPCCGRAVQSQTRVVT